MLSYNATTLLKEYSQKKSLKAYDQDRVKLVFEDIQDLYQSNQSDASLISADSSVDGQGANLIHSILIRHSFLEYNKRCLLAYHHSRLQVIRNLRWQFGAVLPKTIKDTLSPTEYNYFKDYCTNLATYMQTNCDENGGIGAIDLTQNILPPKSLFIEVRCLLDYGEFETEEGVVINLSKGSHHLLSRNDSEELIKQGILEHICN